MDVIQSINKAIVKDVYKCVLCNEEGNINSIFHSKIGLVHPICYKKKKL